MCVYNSNRDMKKKVKRTCGGLPVGSVTLKARWPFYLLPKHQFAPAVSILGLDFWVITQRLPEG